MLIRFAVENYRSYRERQVFSMVAGRSDKHEDHVAVVDGRRILKGSYFFGANASGKSNLFDAIRFAKKIVEKGIKKSFLEKNYFRIEPAYAEKPGVFQFNFFENGSFYEYGFAVSYLDAKIMEEWLYRYESGQEILLFERIAGNPIRTEYSFTEGTQNKEKFQLYAEDIPDNVLFLSEIVSRKLAEHPDFSAYQDVRNWFSHFILISPNTQYGNKVGFFQENATKLSSVLSDFDTGIVSISPTKKPIRDILKHLPDELQKDIIENIEEALQQENADGVSCAIDGRQFEFHIEDGEIIAEQLGMSHGNEQELFQLSDESDGTQRLFDLIPLFRAAKKPHVFLIDELDRSFHTALVQEYIRRFYADAEGADSQLIATVHDTHVMDLSLLRQDEIWFVERLPDHSSSIYSLNQYQERFLTGDISKEYLLGRYGAVPCLMQSELWQKEAAP